MLGKIPGPLLPYLKVVKCAYFILFIYSCIYLFFLSGGAGEGIYQGWYDADEALSKGWWKTLAKENEVQIQI